LFDDIDLLTKKITKPEPLKDIEKESNKIDELLDDDFEEELDNDLIAKKPLIIEDDKSFDIDG